MTPCTLVLIGRLRMVVCAEDEDDDTLNDIIEQGILNYENICAHTRSTDDRLWNKIIDCQYEGNSYLFFYFCKTINQTYLDLVITRYPC